MKNKFVILMLIFIGLNKVFADISISASVDKNVISLDEQVTLQVVVSGNVTNIPQPQIPKLNGFQIYSSGRSQNISIINGQVSSSVSFNYILSPTKIGEFEIPPITVTYQGKTYQTEPIKIKVEKSQVSPRQPTVQKDVYRGDQRDIFVETYVDKKTAYVDEQITLTFRFFTRVNLLSQPQYSPPDTTGFIKEDLPPQRNYYTIINGQRYYVSEIKTALFPTTAGRFTIGPAMVKCVIEDFDINDFFSDDFFKRFFSGGREIVLKSQPIEITVLPLPNPPKNFYGSVGNYRASITIDKQKLEQNETTFLNLKISGTGNIKSITIPKEYIQQLLGNSFIVYEPVTSYDVKKENYLVKGSKTFKIPITPQVPGNLTIPQISFVYFNPNTKQYETAVTEKLQIEVTPKTTTASAKHQYTTTKLKPTQEKIEFEDIRYLKTNFTITKNKKINSEVYLFVQFLPVLLWLGVVGAVKYKNKLTKDFNKYRATKALNYAMRKLKNMKLQKGEQFILGLYDIIAEYIASKMYTTKESLSIETIKQYFENKISGEMLNEIVNLWEEINFYRFAPAQNIQVEPKEWILKVKQILQKLEYELQKR